MGSSEVEIILKATDKASAEIKKTDGGLKGLNDRFQSLTGVSLGSAAAIGAVVGGLKFSIDAAKEAERVMALTEAVIKSTGGAAGFTANEIAELSRQEEILTGIDGDVIQSGNNMLLTFTAIGKDVFPRASKTMQDMAVAFNKGNLEGLDLNATAIQLGKALNVVEGDTAGASRAMSALQRVGVRFTDDQKKLGEELIKNGDVMSFQNLILDELQTEYGGAAEAAGNTFAGAQAKLNNELGNFGEIVGGAIIPTLAEWTGKTVDLLIEMDELRKLTVGSSDAALEAAGSYEDYVAQVQDAISQTGNYINKNGDLVSSQGVLIEKNYLLSKSQFDLNSTAKDLQDRRQQMEDQLGSYKVATEIVTEAVDEEKAAQERLKEELGFLNEAIRGTVSNEMEDFQESFDELTRKIDTNIGTIEELESKEYLTDEQKEKLEEARSEYDENQTKLEELTAKHEESTARIIFGYFEQQAARDELTEAGIEALTEIGVALGIYDETTAETMRRVQKSWAEFNESGEIGKVVSDAEALHRAIDAIPDFKRITIEMKQTGVGLDVTPGGGGRQHGGPVAGGGAYIVGERGPELFVPRQSGEIIPNHQINNNYNLVVNNPRGSESSFLDDIRLMEMLH